MWHARSESLTAVLLKIHPVLYMRFLTSWRIVQPWSWGSSTILQNSRYHTYSSVTSWKTCIFIQEPSIMQIMCFIQMCSNSQGLLFVGTNHVLYINVQWLTEAVVCRHHTRNILSMLPAANSVFSVFTAMSVISADAPRSVANRRPSITLHILTRRSSAPCREGSFMSLTFLGARNTITYLLELP